jgi:transcription elongation factor GreA
MRAPIRKPGKYTHLKSDPHLTQAKLDELKEQLEKLKKFSQPKAADEVRRLAELGDLSENAAYQIAKGRLRGINQKIIELENETNKAIIIKPFKYGGTVQLGCRVTLEISGKKSEYLILGSAETNPGQGVISHNSPIGSAIMGHLIGDELQIVLKGRQIKCKIINIE